MKNTLKDNETMVDKVRERYGEFAKQGGSCCGELDSTGLGYDKSELSDLPDGADLGLGCGAPLPQLDLQPGETVLDLGSGGGIDVFISARAVGPEGRAIGVDMTPEMLQRARAAADKAGLDNVEFREGRLEALPVEDNSIDAVTSNCVINLVPDKRQVFREIGRVLKPGGRLVISDIVLDGPLPERIREDVYAYVGCVSGAERRDTYFEWLADAGLGEIEILSDVDFLAGQCKANPDEAEDLLRRTGVEWAELEGRVRSLTYRARKPAVS